MEVSDVNFDYKVFVLDEDESDDPSFVALRVPEVDPSVTKRIEKAVHGRSERGWLDLAQAVHGVHLVRRQGWCKGRVRVVLQKLLA